MLRTPVLLLVLTLLAPPAATNEASPPALPHTAPARRVAELLEVFNRGDRDALVQYALQSFTPGMLEPNVDSIVDFLMQQYAATRGYDIRRVLQSSEGQISVLVQARQPDDRWMRLIVGAELEEPHRVQGLFTYAASSALAEQSRAPITADQLPQRFVSMLDALADAGDFAGSVCLSKQGKVLVSRAWGEADRSRHIANTVHTQFGIASLGKMFTAVAIAQLVEQGAVRYDDVVTRFIPDWLPPAAGDITVEQLLTHTSGLGDYLEPAMQDTVTHYDTLTDYRRLAVHDVPAFAPGERFRYSNTAYLLLGALIEAITGEPWDRYLQTHIFEVAGMRHTSAYRPKATSDAMATGYFKNAKGHWRANHELLVGRGTPAGGSVSTADDLVAFANALLDGKLVSDEGLQNMTKPRADMQGTGMSYGYGFTMPRGQQGSSTFGHSGGFPGVSAQLEIYGRRGYVLAILSNQDNGAVEAVNLWRDLLVRSALSAD